MENKSLRAFVAGDQYQVVREGCYLRGMRPIGPGVETLWRRDLHVGDVITCAGVAMTAGDGVPIVKWLDEDRTVLANDCEFQPDNGRMWGAVPADGYLVRVDLRQGSTNKVASTKNDFLRHYRFTAESNLRRHNHHNAAD